MDAVGCEDRFPEWIRLSGEDKKLSWKHGATATYRNAIAGER